MEFPDCRIEEYSVDVIAENLMNMADDDRWNIWLLEDIENFRNDDAVAVTKKLVSVKYQMEIRSR